MINGKTISILLLLNIISIDQLSAVKLKLTDSDDDDAKALIQNMEETQSKNGDKEVKDQITS
jgi:hypothetical protein